MCVFSQSRPSLLLAKKASFDAVWDFFDGDKNGELDGPELDKLCAQLLRCLESTSEPTRTQVRPKRLRCCSFAQLK